MMHWRQTIAVLALVISAGRLSAADGSVGDESIQMVVLSEEGGIATISARNRSTRTIEYFHWFAADQSPVPYCKDSTGSIFICALKVVVDDNGNPWIHEQFLKPGATVRFRARIRGAGAVGLKLWQEGRERYVWHQIETGA